MSETDWEPRELPKGLGAIVRATIEDEDWDVILTKKTVLLMRMGKVWMDEEGEYELSDEVLKDTEYVTGLEVLFEGIAE